MYSHVPRNVVTDALIHIRDLYRRIRPTDDQALRAHARREATIRDLLSNLPRTNDHPTLKTVLDVADSCYLTLDGAHRLFGYSLDRVREYDLKLNGGRTHILCTRLAVSELVSADHNGDQARDLCNRSGEQGLQSSEAGIKWRSALGECNCGKKNQLDDEVAFESNPARPMP